MIFAGELIQAARQIRELYPNVGYDHRPHLTEFEPDLRDKQTEKFRRGYAAFKWAAAKVLQPASILEIGVGGGVAALAFLDACPTAHYHGIDNGQLGVERGFDFLADVRHKLAGRPASIEQADTRTLAKFPSAHLVHIDGNHLYDWAYHDMSRALASGARWILADDARDTQVAAATLRAFFDFRQGPFEWAYFDDTWTGSILFCQDIVR